MTLQLLSWPTINPTKLLDPWNTEKGPIAHIAIDLDIPRKLATKCMIILIRTMFKANTRNHPSQERNSDNSIGFLITKHQEQTMFHQKKNPNNDLTTQIDPRLTITTSIIQKNRGSISIMQIMDMQHPQLLKDATSPMISS